MYAVERLSSYITQGVYTVSGPFHPFGGAVDIIVVEQQDGSFKSSPWYVRFGKFQGVLKTKEKIVNISVNGVEAGFHMYLDHKGEAYFLKEVDGAEEESVSYPSSSGDETDEQSLNTRPAKSPNHKFDVINQANVNNGNGKIVARTTSRRARILGLVFGRKTIKENNFCEEGNGASVIRANSVERAEMAADLLEVRWSTNLASKKPRKVGASRISALEVVAGQADEEFQSSGAQSQVSSFLNDDVESSLDDSGFHDESGSPNRDMGNRCEFGSQKSGCFSEESSTKLLSLGTPEQSVVLSILDESGLDEQQCECIPEVSRQIDETSAGSSVHDENSEGVIYEKVSPDSLAFNTTELEEGILSDEEQAFDEKDVVLDGCRSEMNRVHSLYCETSERSTLSMECSSRETHETLYVSSGECGELHALVEAQHVSEVHTTPEAAVLVAKKPLDNLPALRDREGGNVLIDIKTLENEEVCTNSIRNNAVEIEALDVIPRDVISEMLADDFNLEAGEEVALGNHSQHSSPICSCMPGNNEADLELPSAVSELYNQMVFVEPTNGSVEEIKSHSYTVLSSSDSDYPTKSKGTVGNEIAMSELQYSLESLGDSQESFGDSLSIKAMSFLPSEGSEEEHFLFSDFSESKLSEVRSMESTSLDCAERDNHPSHTLGALGGIEGADELVDTTYMPYLSSDKLIPENLPNDFENLIEKQRMTSSAISIPRSHKVAGREIGQLVESLPNVWCHADNLDAVEHPLSHSLDSKPKSSNAALLMKEASKCMKLDTNKEHLLTWERSTVDDTQIPVDLQNIITNPAAEISLCKHLLYEGMGAEAASQAFDSERLDKDKIFSLGPAVTKNDRLVVKIGNHYFPWDAAAPIVLGMLSFENEQLEPKGMIAVDLVEKNPEGDPSKSVVAQSGSWRIWPFSFKRSRSVKTVLPTQHVSISSEAKKFPLSTACLDGDEDVKTKITKRKVKTISPTSEQLASLNLKEGRNLITFTFSTKMLGKQQVDARIYLWKWNTRIVISDVDGTITKSDVLGQFMPLVGVDWSQTGVAHLFSAIKENGYQLLFLSARAISQAYHTRQFLFNLKQDGKALPDGPVVISPDGLFPSLFREVIRRAPHEFKIACLEDIRALFPSDCNPYYAGFGNRDTDEISYLKVGIPKGKIFIINPKGEVVVNHRFDSRSYTSLHALVNGMFPPMSSLEQEDYNSWNYWKLRPPVIDD